MMLFMPLLLALKEHTLSKNEGFAMLPKQSLCLEQLLKCVNACQHITSTKGEGGRGRGGRGGGSMAPTMLGGSVCSRVPHVHQ